MSQIFSPGAWTDVSAWLRQHAPETAALLGDANAGAASEVSSGLGVDLPEDVAAYFDTVPGEVSAGLVFGYLPLPAQACVRTARMLRAVAQQVMPKVMIEQSLANPAGGYAWAWLDQFVPIAASTAGSYLSIDLREGPRRGCVVLFDGDEGMLHEPWFGSIDDLMRQLMGSLAHGQPLAGKTPVIEDGRLTWQFHPLSQER